METPGFYKMQGAGTSREDGTNSSEHSEDLRKDTRFAVNVDSAESDIARLTVDELPVQFQNQSGPELTTALPAAESSPSLFQYILASLVLLLILESFLAWAFGRQSGIQSGRSQSRLHGAS